MRRSSYLLLAFVLIATACGGGGGSGDGDPDTAQVDTTSPDTAVSETGGEDTGRDVPLPPDTGVRCSSDSDCAGRVGVLMECERSACEAGACVKAVALDGTSCDDGDPCTEGDVCTDGACGGAAKACDDANACTDDTCAAGDCTHVSNTAACDDLSACTTDDVCADGACHGTPMACDDPPAAVCASATTLEVFASPGVCDGGTCTWTSDIVDCPEGCVDGVCEGVDPCETLDCTTPPSVCFGAGTCVDGACAYPFAEAACDDGLGCTEGDACDEGVCAGTPIACDAAPAPDCASATERRTFAAVGTCSADSGECEYEATVETCAGGCVDGQCVTGTVAPAFALTASGALDLSSAMFDAQCVMPGWTGGATMRSAHFVLAPGFVP